MKLTQVLLLWWLHLHVHIHTLSSENIIVFSHLLVCTSFITTWSMVLVRSMAALDQRPVGMQSTASTVSRTTSCSDLLLAVAHSWLRCQQGQNGENRTGVCAEQMGPAVGCSSAWGRGWFWNRAGLECEAGRRGKVGSAAIVAAAATEIWCCRRHEAKGLVRSWFFCRASRIWGESTDKLQ